MPAFSVDENNPYFCAEDGILYSKDKTKLLYFPCAKNNDFDRNLANLFRCMKERTMAVIRELGFCHLNSREDFIAVRRFFENEQFDDKYLSEELRLTEIVFPPPESKELH